MARPSIGRIAELQQFIADIAKIERALNIGDNGRLENDAEHSFGLAITCWFMAPKIAPELDIGKILKYALAHDTVELHAGDTFAFGPQELIDSKESREREAIKIIRKDWPDFPELSKFAKDYLDKSDEEAKFVYVVDKILPVLMVNIGEKDKFWQRHKITKEMQKNEKQPKMQASQPLSFYFEELVQWMSDPDYFYKD